METAPPIFYALNAVHMREAKRQGFLWGFVWGAALACLAVATTLAVRP